MDKKNWKKVKGEVPGETRHIRIGPPSPAQARLAQMEKEQAKVARGIILPPEVDKIIKSQAQAVNRSVNSYIGHILKICSTPKGQRFLKSF